MELTLISFAVAGACGTLIGWRWFLDHRAADRAAQRAHELELADKHVVVDQAALDQALAKVGRLEERVKELGYRKA